VALTSGSTAVLPGVFSARAGEENGALALSFEPNFAGMFVIAILCAALTAVFVLRRANSTPGH
jgi:hypothetical protein